MMMMTVELLITRYNVDSYIVIVHVSQVFSVLLLWKGINIVLVLLQAAAQASSEQTHSSGGII